MRRTTPTIQHPSRKEFRVGPSLHLRWWDINTLEDEKEDHPLRPPRTRRRAGEKDNLKTKMNFTRSLPLIDITTTLGISESDPPRRIRIGLRTTIEEPSPASTLYLTLLDSAIRVRNRINMGVPLRKTLLTVTSPPQHRELEADMALPEMTDMGTPGTATVLREERTDLQEEGTDPQEDSVLQEAVVMDLLAEAATVLRVEAAMAPPEEAATALLAEAARVLLEEAAKAPQVAVVTALQTVLQQLEATPLGTKFPLSRRSLRPTNFPPGTEDTIPLFNTFSKYKK